MAWQLTSPPRRRRHILAGLAALIALLALVAGAPIVLLALAGNPLPQHLPSLGEVGELLTSRDNGQLFLRTLALLAWAGWTSFALSVLVEIPAQLARRPTPRLPLLGLQQRMAASLVASIALLGPAGPALTAAPVAHTTPAVAAVYTVQADRLQLPEVVADGAGPVYEVAQDDYLGGVAQRYLGDFNRYPELAAATGITDPDHIEPGQRIQLPTTATDTGTQAHATGGLLTPPTAAPTNGATTPAGPAPAANPAGQPTPAATPNNVSSPSPAVSTTASQAATTPAASPAASPTPASATTTAASAPPTAAGPGDSRSSTANGDSGLDLAVPVTATLATAGLLATLLLTRLRRRRHRQAQHRPVGRRLPAPATPHTETDLHVVAQPAAVDRLDHALRALGQALVDRPADQMPDIVGAWLHGETVHLILTSPSPNPPAPWSGEHATWTLPADAEIPPVDGQLAPLPALVTVGSQPGTHLLLDLERLGLLTLTGDPGRCADLLRYLAAELSCNAWSDDVEVTVAGFDPDQTAQLLALGGERMEAAASIGAAVARIRRRAGQVIQALDHLDVGDPLTGRIADIAADSWMPQVLLAADPTGDETTALQELDRDLAAAGRCAVAVITTSTDLGRWPISVGADGRLTIGFLGMTHADTTLTAAGLPRTELDSLAELLTTARTSTESAASAETGAAPPEEYPPVPPAPEPEPWATGTDAAGGLIDVLYGDDTETEESDTGVNHDEGDGDDEESGATAPAASATSEAGRVPIVIALAGHQPVPRQRVSSPLRRRHADPTLDDDLQAWLDQVPSRPRIGILGPVTVEASGKVPHERQRFYAELIVYVASRGSRGASLDQLDEALWPAHPIDPAARRVALARARRWLGETPDGDKWLPDVTGHRRCGLTDGYQLDWHLFRRLRSRGEAHGPAGASDLRHALALVRGAPLAGADVALFAAGRNPYAWLPTSEIAPQHLTAAVVDTAHRLVDLCLEAGDTARARWAVEQAWLADIYHADDHPWRDALRVAAADGNDAEMARLFEDLMNAREAEVPEDLDRATYALLCQLMPDRMRAGVR